jgi:hypothetical protein
MKTRKNQIWLALALMTMTFFLSSFKSVDQKSTGGHDIIVSLEDDCPCSTCNQTGDCGYCSGNGNYRCAVCNGTGSRGVDSDNNKIDCSSCNGAGTISCSACGGGGRCGTCKGRRKIPCN